MTREEEQLLREKYAGRATSDFARDCKRLARGEPLGYVIGTQPFLGLTIHLDSRPLIPRVETEWWTDQLLKEISGALKGTSADYEPGDPRAAVRLGLAARSAAARGSAGEDLNVLDLCAGSGAIGCAFLKHLPNTHVSFGEIDGAHEATIKKNIAVNGLDASRACVKIGDLFEPFAGERFDLIVANPPYVPSGRALEASVTDFEPALALRAGAQGLDVIERIAQTLSEHLAPGGQAWVECDSEFGETARALFTRAGLFAALRTDQFQMPRVLVVRFPQ